MWWPGSEKLRLRLSIWKHTGMAVIIDLADAHNPNDIHPKNKQDVKWTPCPMGSQSNLWDAGIGRFRPPYECQDQRGVTSFLQTPDSLRWLVRKSDLIPPNRSSEVR